MMKPMRIAIADDEAEIRLYFQRLLLRLGHEVENGRELVELCRTAHPDLIITDIRMPEMDGIAAVSQIARSQKIPVIVVSSHDPPEDNGHAQIVAFLVKPIKIADLEAAIAKANAGA